MILPFIQSGIRLSQIEGPNAWQRYDIRRKTINSRLWFYAAKPYEAHLLPHSFLSRLRFFIMGLFSTDYILICILFQCYEYCLPAPNYRLPGAYYGLARAYYRLLPANNGRFNSSAMHTETFDPILCFFVLIVLTGLINASDILPPLWK